MDGSDVREFCRAMPKIELHAHLLGSVRPSSLQRRLEQNVGPAEAARLMQRSRVPPSGIDLDRSMSEQMEMFDIARSAFHTPADKRQVAVEFIEDCAAANVAYLELRTSGSDEEKFASVLAAFAEARHRGLPVVTRMLCSVQRSWSFAQAERSVRLAVEHAGRGVVGVDLAGDPASGDFRRLAPLFQYAQREGLRFTCHFAESRGEADLAAILDARPDRLGHCCYLHEAPELQQRVLDARIPIEACLASNINVMRLTGGVATHPVVEWIRRAHPFVPCTDNVGLLGSDLSAHYAMLAPWLSRGALWRLAEGSVEHVFAGEDVKQELRGVYRDARRRLAAPTE